MDNDEYINNLKKILNIKIDNYFESIFYIKEMLFDKHNYDIRIKKSKMFDFYGSSKDNIVYKTYYSIDIVFDKKIIKINENKISNANSEIEATILGIKIVTEKLNLI